jgi:hypothetical protein
MMTVIAALFVIALIGLLVSICFIIAVALNFRTLPGRIARLVEPPKASATALFNTGKGIAQTGKRRFDGYTKQGKRIAAAVKQSADEVGTAAKSVNVNDAKSTLKAAAASINAAQEGLATAKAVLDILSRSKKTE